MADQLVDFLRSRKEQAASQEIDWQAKKDAWVRSVESLYELIREMLRDSTASKDLMVRAFDVQVTEDFIGTYSIPVLELSVGSERVEFRPKGITVIGAAGGSTSVASAIPSRCYTDLFDWRALRQFPHFYVAHPSRHGWLRCGARCGNTGGKIVMLRKDIKEAIARLWPDGLVEMNVDPEDSWFVTVQPKLTRALARLKGAQLLFQREAAGKPGWWPESDPEEDPPDDSTRSRSYHLYFVAPQGKTFEFTAESEGYVDDPDGDVSMETIRGEGRSGWCVAVSLLAPFAVIALGERIEYGHGEVTEPTIESYMETMDGDPIDPVRHFRETVSEEAFSQLMSVHRMISEILEKREITVLPEEEWRKPAPHLRAGEEVLAPRPLRVLDALFFEEI